MLSSDNYILSSPYSCQSIIPNIEKSLYSSVSKYTDDLEALRGDTERIRAGVRTGERMHDRALVALTFRIPFLGSKTEEITFTD